MEDERKTKKQLIEELNALRQEQIEQTRVTQEKFTKAFLQNSIPAVITTAKEGRFVEVSDAFLRLVELKRDEVVGHTAREIGFLTEEQTWSFFNELSKYGRIENLEIALRPKDKGLRYGLFNVVMISINNENCLLTSIQDITERKQVEAELRESEEKYRNIFQNASIGIFHTSPEGKILQVNPVLSRMFGYASPEEMIAAISNIGKQIYVDTERRSNLIDAAMDSNDWSYSENLLRRKNGTIMTATMSLRKILEPDGTVAYLEGFVEDITIRKQAEEKLRESEARLRVAISNTKMVFAQTDLNARYTWIVHPHKDFDQGALLGKTDVEIADNAGSRKLFQIKQQVIAKGIRAKTEITFPVSDGARSYDIVIDPLHDMAGRVIGTVTSSYDITDRKRAEDALRESEKKYRNLFEMESDALLLIDAQSGKILDANHATVALYGYSIDELLGMKNVDLSAEPEKTKEYSVRAATSGTVVIPLRYHRKKDGTVFPVEITATSLVWNGQPVIIPAIRDITERKLAEEVLQLSNKRLEEAQKTAKIGDWEANLLTDELHWSPTIFDIFGLDSKSHKPSVKEFYDAVHPDDRDLVMESEKRSEQTGLHDVVHRIILPSGEIRFVHELARRYKDDQGKLIMLRGTVQDVTDQKRAEASLGESEKKFRSVFESFEDIYFETDLSGNITLVSPSVYRISGWKPEELIGKLVTLFYARPEDRPALLTAILSCGYVRDYEINLIMRDGSKTVASLAAHLVYDSSGTPAGLAGSFRDITERKKMEEVLAKSEEKFRLITENMVDCVALVDASGTYQYVTSSYRETLGYGSEDMVGITGFSILHPDDLERVLKLYMEGMDQGVCELSYEARLRHRDGHYVSMEIRTRSLNDPQGKIIGGVLAARDITKRIQAEDALRKNEDNLAKSYESLTSILDSLDSLVYVVDFNSYEILFINKYGRDIWGDIQGRKCWQTIQKDKNGPCSFCTNDKLLSDAGIPTGVYQWEFQNTVTGRWYECRDQAISWIGKALVRMEIATDITAQKNAEAEKEKLEAQNRQLQKSESLGRMAGAIAHHFNNQLGVVMGNLEMAMDELPQDAGPINKLNAAMQATGKAAQMSGLMLTFLGQSPDKREPLDIAEACLRSQPAIRAVMPGNVVMENNLPSPGPVINANANQIQQVLTNLLTNAREAIGDKKGTISLNVKTVSPAEIPSFHRFPSDWQPKDKIYACIEVKDTGCGIKDEDMEKVFDPFFSTKFTGRGMGLAVVLGIVKAHGGLITMESKPGSGSTFRVFFPVSAEALSKQTDKAFLPLAIEEGGTVLLVEDEEMLRIMVANMLKRLGFSVRPLHNSLGYRFALPVLTSVFLLQICSYAKLIY